MERVENIAEAKNKVLYDMNAFILSIRQHASDDISDLSDGLLKLRNIRTSVYENLNQIQHEYLILQGMVWLSNNGYDQQNIHWFWNPRQTGDSFEPDLRGVVNGAIVVSAEATTSEKPQGVIDTRMRNTLAKLDQMKGDKYYFIRTSKMEQRAKTKVTNKGWEISVIKIDD